ncbi:MAG: antirepressor regulating drug resistance protein [Clostridia bacterium]|jgi:beta-lactamase regulating signal transducer with metallopeptidase domain|nr:antirepressor regulating drug resistance protein [Clostridia bacterium]
MEHIFLTVLNMSATSSYVILFVIVVRMFLKKTSKIFSYGLWSVVLFRLICPFSFSSSISFLGLYKAHTMAYVPVNSADSVQQLNVGTNGLDNWVTSSQGAAVSGGSISEVQSILAVLLIIWLTGAACLVLYSLLSYRSLIKKVSIVKHISNNIFECAEIKSPFVMGIIKPKIYIPLGLAENERHYVLMHEQIHIKRLDYLLKPLAFFTLCIHWFNPFVWAAFRLMTHDMEMSCDEQVLRKLGKSIKKDYSHSLLAFAVSGQVIGASPLAFGESSIKGRIKNILSYKKPSFWGIIAAAFLVIAAAMGLLSNPIEKEQDLSFLNIENAASAAIQSGQLMIRVPGAGATLTSGSQFGEIIGSAADNWRETRVSSASKLLPSLTIYINLATNYKVHFYESEPELAAIVYDEKSRWYKIPQDTYKKAYMMYALSSYMVPDEVMKAIADGKKTTLQSVNDTPNQGDYQAFKIGNEIFYFYKKGLKYYVEQPYQSICVISEQVYKEAIGFVEIFKPDNTETTSEIGNLVEDNLRVIMSSPLSSSSPNSYINANSNAYENIMKYGGEEALAYMLSEFRVGKVKNDLRGQIMMRLCIELLGQRNNVRESDLLPNEWFGKLNIREAAELPDFSYSGIDPVKKLVYLTEIEKNMGSVGQFTIAAPHIFGSYEEDNKLKVFATTFIKHYTLYDKTLSEEGGSVVPAAITYAKDAKGNYVLEEYKEARDGSEFAKSISEFCILPVSRKKISHLADEILKHYSDYNDITHLERENLIEHLGKNNQYGIVLHDKNIN